VELALIPPKGLEQYALLSNFQLPLAHVTEPEYLGVYATAQKRGDYLILDNGVAEGVTLRAKDLIVRAGRMGVSELVLPDVMNDHAATLATIGKFLGDAKQMPHAYYNTLKLMAVAHGASARLAQTLIDAVASMPEVAVIGIPRCAIGSQNLGVRIDLANWINETFPGRFEIHLLGTNPAWPREIASAARYAPHIRSVDTSMPFNYASRGVRLDLQKLPSISRPEGYFTVPFPVTEVILRHNINTMLGWVHAQAPVS